MISPDHAESFPLAHDPATAAADELGAPSTAPERRPGGAKRALLLSQRLLRPSLRGVAAARRRRVARGVAVAVVAHAASAAVIDRGARVDVHIAPGGAVGEDRVDRPHARRGNDVIYTPALLW